MAGHLSLSPRRAGFAAAGMLAAAAVAVAGCGSKTDLGVGAPVVTTPPPASSPSKADRTVPTTPAPPTVPTTTSTNAPNTSPSSPTTASSGTVPSASPSASADRSGSPSAGGGAPCSLTRTGTSQVPVAQVCSATGAPHFDTPQAAMAYLANAWNAGNVEQIDYVTDPTGREQLDSMANMLVNLRFERCAANPGGDYTCFFSHDIVPSSSPTTYPNPMNYPPGEAVFTAAPAATPGWYLTEVIHCG